MTRRFPLAVAAAAALLALAAPPALAGDPSSVNVYVQQLPTASGHKSVPGGGTTAPAPSMQSTVPLPSSAATQLQRKGGKDKNLLKEVATSEALGATHKISAPALPRQTPPSAIDLGRGPNTVLIALLAAAALLVLGGGLHRRRRSN